MPAARTLPELREWHPLNLQLIVFPTDPPAAIQKDWWEQFTHERPSETRQKRIERIDTGLYNDLKLTVTADLQKIAWIIEMQSQVDELPGTLPTLGSYPDIRDRFLNMMTPWLERGCPEIKRLAFTGALTQPVQGHESGYRRLAQYLPAVQIDPSSNDFHYRINRKKSSAWIPGLMLNRLNMWSLARFRFEVQAQVLFESPPAGVLREEHWVCMLQLDVNTDAERMEPLPRDMLSKLFHELVGKATEIAEQGDRPS
jgi:hypothetical protein